MGDGNYRQKNTKRNYKKMNEETIYQWALKYIKHGFSIIPVGTDKKPIVSWLPYQTTRATEQQVKEWFDVPNPPNIAIITGEISGVTVVDVEKGGKWEHYPVTMTARSGGGGYHLYYKYAPGVQNRARVHELTDIRGNGGYIIAPPSKHASGGTYEFIRKEATQPFPYQMFNETPEKRKETKWDEIMQGVPDGGRNQTAAVVIGKILNSIHPLDWATVAWEMVVLWNGRNIPPLEEKELRGVFNSIIGREIRSGKREERIKKEIPQITEDCDIKKIGEIARDLTDDLTVSYPTGYPSIDIRFKGGLKDGDLIFLTGHTGFGKTTLAQSMTYNLVKAGQPCLWFSFEVPLGELWRKFKDMGVDENFDAYTPEKNISQQLEWVKKKIIESRDRFKTKVVFIDHLGFLAQEPKNYDSNLASNYATILTMICRQLKTLAIQENICVVLLGHLRKTANGMSNDPTINDIKDSSGVAQESDGVFIIHRERESKGSGSTEIYKPESIIKIEKNRRTGQTKIVPVILQEGRLVETTVVMQNIGTPRKPYQENWGGF